MPFYFILLILLLPVTGFCADSDSQDITEKEIEKEAEKAVEKAIEKAAEKTTTEVVEKVTEKAIEKAAEEEKEKQELKAKRPDEWKGPTRVHFFMFVLDIDAIDDANQSFNANIFLRLRWQDNRLVDPLGSIRQIPLEDVWNPQVIIANSVGIVSKALPEVVQVHPDGEIVYRQRFTGSMSQPLNLKNFPLDKHEFFIHFVSSAYSDDKLEFIADASEHDSKLIGGSIAEKLSLPDWKVSQYKAINLPYQPIKEIHAAGFASRFEAERYVDYYLWQVILPLLVVVIMSWSGFWIKQDQTGVRIGVATSSILTLIAHRFVLASLLPRLPYMTRLDYFTVGSTLLVFTALLIVVATSHLAAAKHESMAKRIDLLSRGAFPATFFLLLGWFLLGRVN